MQAFYLFGIFLDIKVMIYVSRQLEDFQGFLCHNSRYNVTGTVTLERNDYM